MAKKIDYAFKAKVLEMDLPKFANAISKAIYAKWVFDTYGEKIVSMDYDTAIDYRDFFMRNYPVEYAEAEKINMARYKRVSRLRKYIAKMLYTCDDVVFLTLTFNDDVLSSTSQITRRRYVQRFLTSCHALYVANIDFGALDEYKDSKGKIKKGTHREHYHAVVGARVSVKRWHYGFAFAETVKSLDDLRKPIPKRYQDLPENVIKIRMQIDDEKRLSKYVAKLTNHAIKETTKQCRMLYPKTVRERPFLIEDEKLFENPFENCKK